MLTCRVSSGADAAAVRHLCETTHDLENSRNISFLLFVINLQEALIEINDSIIKMEMAN
jgi:hypothetical protein